MDYPRISSVVYGEPWAVTVAQHEAIQEVLKERIRGGSQATDHLSFRARGNHFCAQTLSLTPPRSRDSRVYRRGAMAYIPVSGVIGKGLGIMEQMCGGYNIDQLSRDVDEVITDASVKNVLFDYDSPGGRIQGVPEASKMLQTLRGSGKNTYSFSSSEAASAACWLYQQADVRYLTESAVTGAVGVIVVMMDRTEQLKAQGISPIIVKAGAHKGAGLPGNPMTAEQLQMLQDQVDLFYAMMTKDIKSAHAGIDDSALQGQTFIGRQALKAKLADGIVNSLGTLVEHLS